MTQAKVNDIKLQVEEILYTIVLSVTIWPWLWLSGVNDTIDSYTSEKRNVMGPPPLQTFGMILLKGFSG